MRCSRGLLQFSLLGGSGVVIRGVTSPLIWVISIVTLSITLLALLITTHEPPSKGPWAQIVRLRD